MKKHTGEKMHYIALIDALTLEAIQKQIAKTTWLDYLMLMNKSARKGWFSHNWSQILVVLLSLLIPIIERSRLNANIYSTGI